MAKRIPAERINGLPRGAGFVGRPVSVGLVMVVDFIASALGDDGLPRHCLTIKERQEKTRAARYVHDES
jgi:hypothetical protein